MSMVKRLLYILLSIWLFGWSIIFVVGITMEGNSTTAIIVAIAMGILSLVGAYYSFKKGIRNNAPVNPKAEIIKAETKKAEPISVNYYDSQAVEAIVFQTLETLYLIHHSKNIDTVISRFDFLEEKLIQLFHYKSENVERFGSSVILGADKYNHIYYDNPIPKYMIQEVEEVEITLDSLKYLRVECLRKSYKRYKKIQYQQISKLKQKKAIEKRYVNLLNLANKLLIGAKEVTSDGGETTTLAISEYHVAIGELEQKIKAICNT